MPKDDIASSIKLSEWLDSLDIHIEVDKHAPVVVFQTHTDAEGRTTADGEDVLLKKATEEDEPPDGYGGYWLFEYICPYFGPGGADNSLKALTEWCVKNEGHALRRAERGAIVEWWIETLPVPHSGPSGVFVSEGKTDGIALRTLLCKLMEEMK